MPDKDTTPPDKITCKTCGRTNVPDWNGKGQCVSCARDAVLGSDHTDASELREAIKRLVAGLASSGDNFRVAGEVEPVTQEVKDEYVDSFMRLFKQYAQPPVVADEELDEILGEIIEAYGSDRKYPNTIVDRSKAALLQREQRLVAEARIDELERMEIYEDTDRTQEYIKERITTLEQSLKEAEK